jgi:integrase
MPRRRPPRRLRLTKRSIDAATYKGGGSRFDVLYDTEVRGFGLRVYPSGEKSFVLRYRTRGGRVRLLTIGRYGPMSLAEARERARRTSVKVMDGGDPVAERQKDRAADTLRAFADLYLERHAKARKMSWRDDQRRLENRILPDLGNRKLAEIRRSDLAALHSKIGRRAPYEANRVLRLLSIMFTLAERWGHLPEGSPNPASGIGLFREKSRDRYVTPAELPRLAEAINAEPNLYVRGALWLYLLTGVRKSELLRVRWKDVNADRKELRLEETKAGRPHVVPLSAAALEVLKAIPRQQGNPYLFPGRFAGQPLRGFDPQWRAIRKRAGLEDLRLHDLRRTVGSWLAMGGASLPLIGKVLNHSNPSTTQVYARLANDVARSALDGYGQRILEVAGATPDLEPITEGEES